jgi:hypothetical protein
LETHQPKLNPINAFPTASPSKQLARRDRKTCWCPASWPTKPSWVNITPRNAATPSVAHELPTTSNAAHPAANAAMVRTIFTL